MKGEYSVVKIDMTVTVFIKFGYVQIILYITMLYR